MTGKKTYSRSDRVGPAIKEVVGEQLQRKVKDPRVSSVVVTNVSVSPDLKSARVYYYLMDETVPVAEAQRGLDSAAGYLRHALGQELQLRYSPRLSFIRDEAVQRGRRIEEILRDMHDQEAPLVGDEGTSGAEVPPARDEADDSE